jgi:hypothetical protein
MRAILGRKKAGQRIGRDAVKRRYAKEGGEWAPQRGTQTP